MLAYLSTMINTSLQRKTHLFVHYSIKGLLFYDRSTIKRLGATCKL